MKIARVYLRVSTDEQDLTRQNEIIENARNNGFYVAGIYKEKASGARADRPELQRMIDDLQLDEVVIAEHIDRISRLPLDSALALINSIKSGARSSPFPVLWILPNWQTLNPVSRRSFWNLFRICYSKFPCSWQGMSMKTVVNARKRALSWLNGKAGIRGELQIYGSINASLSIVQGRRVLRKQRNFVNVALVL